MVSQIPVGTTRSEGCNLFNNRWN